MKRCYKCNVGINSSSSKCPLCGNDIDDVIINTSAFPVIPNMYVKHGLFFKLLLFLSLFGCVVCTIINYKVSGKINWSLFVIAGIFSFWLTFIIGIKRRHHFMRLLFAEVMILLLVSILWDYFTGWHLWSITYVLPFLCISYVTTLFILRIFMKDIFKDYVIYIYINSLVGLIPIYFILKKILKVEWPSILCIIFSVFSILILAVFNHHQMKSELERRLHI